MTTHRYPDGSWDRRFTLVLSTDPGAPDRCKLMDKGNEMFIGWRQIPGRGAANPDLPTVPYNPSIVYRCVRGGAVAMRVA
jgi:hypothetical protein